MNSSLKFILCILAVFLFIFAFEWIWHGYLMGDLYVKTKALWRPEEQMHGMMLIMLFGQLLIATMFCVIFSFGYEGKGILEGARYGIYVALLMTGPHLIMYAVSPYPILMVSLWTIAGFIEFVLAGVIAALIYEPIE